jgi:glucan 1,3-beta-glucosidase
MGAIQSETAYFQPNPNSIQPFHPQVRYTDPTFAPGPACTGDACLKTWGLRIINSTNVFSYGAGLYSFFDNYAETCTKATCQQNMVDIVDSSAVYLWGLSTKAAANMVTHNGVAAVRQIEDGLNNTSTFCDTIAVYEVPPLCGAKIRG